MSENPNIMWHDNIQPVVRTSGSGESPDYPGTRFDVRVTGPGDMVRNYLKHAHIRCEVRPWRQMPFYQQREPPDELPPPDPAKRPLPDLDARSLNIEIGISGPYFALWPFADPAIEPDFGLYVDVDDPQINKGEVHRYGVTAGALWVRCDSSQGDADIYLYEDQHPGWGWWYPRGQSLNSSITDLIAAADGGPIPRWWSGSWRLKVQGWAATSFYNVSSSTPLTRL